MNSQEYDFLWVQIQKSPWWPAQCVPLSAAPPEALQQLENKGKADDHRLFLKLFGSEAPVPWGFALQDAVRPFHPLESGNTDFLDQSALSDSKLKDALLHAKRKFLIHHSSGLEFTLPAESADIAELTGSVFGVAIQRWTGTLIKRGDVLVKVGRNKISLGADEAEVQALITRVAAQNLPIKLEVRRLKFQLVKKFLSTLAKTKPGPRGKSAALRAKKPVDFTKLNLQSPFKCWVRKSNADPWQAGTVEEVQPDGSATFVSDQMPDLGIAVSLAEVAWSLEAPAEADASEKAQTNKSESSPADLDHQKPEGTPKQQQQAPGKVFTEDEQVEALWQGGEEWYAGVVSQRNDDGTYDIQYDDGDKEGGVPAVLIRAFRGRSKRSAKKQPKAPVISEDLESGEDSQFSGGEEPDDDEEEEMISEEDSVFSDTEGGEKAETKEEGAGVRRSRRSTQQKTAKRRRSNQDITPNKKVKAGGSAKKSSGKKKKPKTKGKDSTKKTQKEENPTKQQTDKFPMNVRTVLAEREVPTCQFRRPRFPKYVPDFKLEFTRDNLRIPWSAPGTCQCGPHCEFATEYLVRWEGLAYQYTQWVEELSLESDYKGDRAIKIYINKQLDQSLKTNLNGDDEDDKRPFNEDFLQIERIVAEKIITVKTIAQKDFQALGFQCKVCSKDFHSDWELEMSTALCFRCGDRCHEDCTVVKETLFSKKGVSEKRSCKPCDERCFLKENPTVSLNEAVHQGTNVPAFTCEKCSKSFKSSSGLGSHLKFSLSCKTSNEEETDAQKKEVCVEEAPQNNDIQQESTAAKNKEKEESEVPPKQVKAIRNQKIAFTFTKGAAEEFEVEVNSGEEVNDEVVLITKIADTAPEELKSKIKEGDAILELGRLDATRVKDLSTFNKVLSRIPQGNTVSIKVIHNFVRPSSEKIEGCQICQYDDDWDNMLLCDFCNSEFHCACYGLDQKPADNEEFLCRNCMRNHTNLLLEKQEETMKVYLVKWRGLPISEGTWEPDYLIGDEEEIEKYNVRNQIPKALDPICPGSIEVESLTPSTIPLKNITLRDYQVEGVNWILNHWENNISCMLADEMGLGKTVQTIASLAFLHKERRPPTPFLVVAPLSTIGHWLSEFDGFSDLNTVVFHGTAEDRSLIWKHEMFHESDEGKTLYKVNCLLTTYETCKAETSKLAKVNWSVMVIDEGHRLKGMETQMRRILQSDVKSSFRLLLTGTPIQNSIEELYSLLHFLNPTDFSKKERFMDSYGNMQESEQVSQLQHLLRRYMLRRVKTDVEKNLPKKMETIIDVELTALQKQYYRAILEKNRKFLNRGLSKSGVPSLINIMMELRKLCNHPYLVKGVRERLKSKHTREGRDELYTSDPLVLSCGKMILLDKLMKKLKKDGSKVLIFSQMRKVLDILEEFLMERGYKFERLDGMVTGRDRAAAIQAFNDKCSNIFCFLLTTKAGGVGLNLQTADTVIIFDSDWNPQNDIQAMARSHRIGQTKEVKVYRLVTRKTYERQLFQAASYKLGLDIAVLGGLHEDFAKQESGSYSNKRLALSGEEIENVLKKGAYELLNEDDEAAVRTSKAYAEEDIESILKTASHQVVYDQEEGKRGPSTFSQATFISSTSKPDIAVDDPDFWAKMLPQAPTLIEQLTLAIMEDAETPSEFSMKDDTTSETGTETGLESEASSGPQPGGALATPQGRLQFLNSVRAAADPIIQARKQGELPDDMEDMLQLLQAVQDHDRFASSEDEDVRSEMASLMLAIEKPKRRRTQRIGLSEDHQQWSDESDNEEDGADGLGDSNLTSKQRAELRQRLKRRKLEARKEQRHAAIQQRKASLQIAREERKRQRQEAVELRKQERARLHQLKKQQQQELLLQRQKQAELAKQEKLAQQKALEQHKTAELQKHKQKMKEQAERNKVLKDLRQGQKFKHFRQHRWRNVQFMKTGTVPGVHLPSGEDFVAVFQNDYTGCRLSEQAGLTLVEKKDPAVPMRCIFPNICRDILLRVNNLCVLGIPSHEVANIIEKSPPVKVLLLRRPAASSMETLEQSSKQEINIEEGVDFDATFTDPNFGCLIKQVDGVLRIWSLNSSSPMKCCYPTLESDIVLGINGDGLVGKSLKEVILTIKSAALPRVLQLRRPKPLGNEDDSDVFEEIDSVDDPKANEDRFQIKGSSIEHTEDEMRQQTSPGCILSEDEGSQEPKTSRYTF